jgi:hypothetical protein
LKGQTLSKGLDVGHIQIQTTFYKIRVKKLLSFLASSTFFKYAQNEGFAFKKFKMFMGGRYPTSISMFGNICAPTFTPGLPDF